MKRNADHLVTINVGMGRDSIAMLCLLIEGALFTGGGFLHVSDVDAAIFADPGAEWAHTYAELPRWFWALRETDPQRWAEVLAYEAAALGENPKMWVSGRSKMPLPAAVDRWREANPRATVEDVLDKAYSRCKVPVEPAT